MPTSVPDTDNVLKAVSDAMNGIVYRDDSQVVNAVVWKRYSEQDANRKVEITVREIGAHGCGISFKQFLSMASRAVFKTIDS